MQIISSSIHDQRLAFTLTEVMVAVGVIGILFVSLYLTFSAGFSMMRTTQENMTATEVMVQRAETIRLYNWTQLMDPTFYKTNFVVNSTNSVGTSYYGTVDLSVPAGYPAAYNTNMRIVTISVRWTNAFGKPLPHYREMQTQVAKYGSANGNN